MSRMARKWWSSSIFLVALTLLTACGGHQSSPQSWAERLQQDPAPDSIAFRYARLIHVEQRDDCRIVYIDNPWKPGKTLHTYVLVDRGEGEGVRGQNNPLTPHPSPLTTQQTVVRVPLQRSVVFTSVHCALLDQLQATAQVAGVADLKYIKVPFVQEGVKSGTLADCGDGMSPLVEKIIDAGADAILLSPFENSGGYGRLEDIDIPIIECAEYMETSPLARAEWMRFYGMLYGKEKEADSLFREVETRYDTLRQLATTGGSHPSPLTSHPSPLTSHPSPLTSHPSVVMDKMAGSVWYVPGGRSTIGQMLADACAEYPWADDNHSGSLQLSFETVLERAGHCQLWLLRYDSPQPLTLSALLSEKDGYRMMKAKDIYACNVSTSMFYEETPFRPDLLLQDFIKILHPNIPNLPPLRYYQKVE